MLVVDRLSAIAGCSNSDGRVTGGGDVGSILPSCFTTGVSDMKDSGAVACPSNLGLGPIH